MGDICLLNMGEVPAANFPAIVRAIEAFVRLVEKEWKLPRRRITTVPFAGDILIRVGRSRWHTGNPNYKKIFNGDPKDYVAPKVSWFKALWVWSLELVGVRVALPVVEEGLEYFYAGITCDIAHEVSEILINSNVVVQMFSGADWDNRQWLIGICDNVFGTYFYHHLESGEVCVLPNFALPNFYKIFLTSSSPMVHGGYPPYDFANKVTRPFTLTPDGYGLYKGVNKELTKL